MLLMSNFLIQLYLDRLFCFFFLEITLDFFFKKIYSFYNHNRFFVIYIQLIQCFNHLVEGQR